MEDAGMAERRHEPEEIVAKLRRVEVLVSQGRSVAEAVRSIGVTAFTDHRGRKEFGGLRSERVRRLKDLEKANERLRKAVSDPTPEQPILREAALGSGRAPPAVAAASMRHDEVRHVRADGMPRAGAASLDAEKGAQGTSR
jgi:hypothetical protein